MSPYFAFFLGSIFTLIGCKYTKIKTSLAELYDKWKSLNELVATTERSKVKITWISLKLAYQSMYISLIQRINTSVEKIDRKTYEIRYVIDGKLYKMIVMPRRGPAPILQISDECQNDITEKVLPYMGPQYDWHGTRFTPRFFGHKLLIFELMDGTEHVYETDSHVNYSNEI